MRKGLDGSEATSERRASSPRGARTAAIPMRPSGTVQPADPRDENFTHAAYIHHGSDNRQRQDAEAGDAGGRRGHFRTCCKIDGYGRWRREYDERGPVDGRLRATRRFTRQGSQGSADGCSQAKPGERARPAPRIEVVSWLAPHHRPYYTHGRSGSERSAPGQSRGRKPADPFNPKMPARRTPSVG
jgi:hypothetical protein